MAPSGGCHRKSTSSVASTRFARHADAKPWCQQIKGFIIPRIVRSCCPAELRLWMPDLGLRTNDVQLGKVREVDDALTGLASTDPKRLPELLTTPAATCQSADRISASPLVSFALPAGPIGTTAAQTGTRSVRPAMASVLSLWAAARPAIAPAQSEPLVALVGSPEALPA